MPRGVVVFDAVGTLIAPRSAAQTYCQVAAAAGVERSPELVQERLRAALVEGERAAAQGPTSTQNERAFWQQVVEFALQPPSDVDLFAPLWERFARADAWCVLPHAAEVLAALRDSQWEIAIASNFDSRLRKLLPQLAGLPSEMRVFCCDEVGWRKPHASFFAAVSAALPPGRRVMVGDDFGSDVIGPSRAGWQAVLIGTPPAPLPPRCRAVACLSLLPEHLRQWR